MVQQYLQYGSDGVTETFGSVTQMIKLTGCAVEGDQVFEHNTRSFFDAGVLSDLYVNATANSLNAASTVRSIKGATSYTDGNLVVTFATSTAGELSDTSNTDAVANADNWSWEIDSSASSSGTMTLDRMENIWEADSGAITICGCGGASSLGISAVSTQYLCMFGLRQTNTTEAFGRSITAAPGTWQNLTVGVVGTAATTVDITHQARIDGVDGNQSVFTDETTSQSLVSDTTNTDTLVAGDLPGIEVDCTTHSGTFGYDIESYYSQIDSTGSADYTQCMTGGSRQIIPNANSTFLQISGGMDITATEANLQNEIKISGTASHMACLFSQGVGSADTTIQFRIDGADGNQNFVFNGPTGSAVDSSNTDDVTAGDLLCMQADIVSGNIRVQASALRLTETAAGATPPRVYLPLLGVG